MDSAHVGTTIAHVWPEGPWPGSGYRHEYLSPDQLRWTGIGGSRAGKSDTEQYVALQLAPTVLQIAFTERQSQLSKTLTYDFARGKVYGVMFLPDGRVVPLVGDIVDHA